MFEEDKKRTPEEIANDKQAEIDTAKEEQKSEAEKQAEATEAKAEEKKEESKNASTDSQSGKKDLDKLSEAEKLEAQAKKDEHLLSVSSEDAEKLSEEDKSRLKELTKKQDKSNVQKRFDQLTREKKEAEEARDVDHQKLKDLQERMNALENPPKKEDYFVTVEKDRIARYIKEDDSKPLTSRREMTKEELEEWALEDNLAAQEWITTRTIRRADEKKADKANSEAESTVNKLLDAQQPYIDKTVKVHPELDTAAREKELAEEGKSKQEVFDILCKENNKYKVIQEVLQANPNFYTLVNGPELAVKEMEKRMKSSGHSNKETKEEYEARIKAQAIEEEKQRQAEIDEANSDGSSHTKDSKKKVEKTEFEIAQEQVAQRSGLSLERVTKRINKRKEDKIR